MQGTYFPFGISVPCSCLPVELVCTVGITAAHHSYSCNPLSFPCLILFGLPLEKFYGQRGAARCRWNKQCKLVPTGHRIFTSGATVHTCRMDSCYRWALAISFDKHLPLCFFIQSFTVSSPCSARSFVYLSTHSLQSRLRSQRTCVQDGGYSDNNPIIAQCLHLIMLRYVMFLLSDHLETR